ncbi:MAG: polyprenyl synthetase family protein, partial [Clostridiales bacterium]|nr:polyprenyl synthetase family protein [Clostridiales bacterium]
CENFACAIEMIHTYSLIHDDLPAMDNDDLRRGKPTNHKMFGEDVAILAGDALLNRAFELMADAVYFNHSAAVAMREVINAAGSAGMIGGQMMDISFPSAEYPPEKILEIYSKKTSALFSAALSVGAILGDASIHDNNILKKVGNLLGLAFQIKDDILDETGTTEQLGKNAKSDIKNKKTTYVSLYGIDAANEKYAEISNEINKELNKVSKDTSKLRELTEIITRRSN